MLRIGDEPRLLRWQSLALFRFEILAFPLDVIGLPDVAQHLFRQLAFAGGLQIEKLAPGMLHAADLGLAPSEADLAAAIVVTHQLVAPVTEEVASKTSRRASARG
jgi:hypothetical protein